MTAFYRSKATGTVLRAEIEGRKVAVFYPYPEHAGQPSWLTKAELRAKFDRVNPRTVEPSK